MMDIIIQK